MRGVLGKSLTGCLEARTRSARGFPFSAFKFAQGLSAGVSEPLQGQRQFPGQVKIEKSRERVKSHRCQLCRCVTLSAQRARGDIHGNVLVSGKALACRAYLYVGRHTPRKTEAEPSLPNAPRPLHLNYFVLHDICFDG
jgi:hypothetical protein